jgi:hypothetical protein
MIYLIVCLSLIFNTIMQIGVRFVSEYGGTHETVLL